MSNQLIKTISIVVLLGFLITIINFSLHSSIMRQSVEIKNNAEDFVNQYCKYKPPNELKYVMGVKFDNETFQFDWVTDVEEQNR